MTLKPAKLANLGEKELSGLAVILNKAISSRRQDMKEEKEHNVENTNDSDWSE